MTTARTDAQIQLEEHMDALVAGGAGLDEILAELDRLGLVEGDNAPQDDAGRPVVAVDCPDEAQSAGARPYFNIRDRAAGNPVAARELAEWALRQYRKAMTAKGDADEAAARQVAMIEAWRAGQVAKADRDAAFFEGLLDQYQEDFGCGERTLKLIGGALKLKKNKRLIYWQEDRAKQWAMAQTDKVDDLCPRGFAKSAVKSLLTKRPDGSYILTETGEVVDWVKDVDPPTADTFTVELT